MGFFSELFKGPEIDMEKSNANAKKMRVLFNQVVEEGDNYRLIFGYTEEPLQLWICSWKQNKNRKFNCRLERSQSDNCCCSYSAQSFWLRPSDLLSPFGNFESLP